MGRPLPWIGAALALLATGACGTAYTDKFAPTPPPGVSSTHPETRFFSFDAASRTALLTLIAGYSAGDNAFNFDGYSRGGMAVTVPAGWRVTVQCANRGTLRHSCAIVSGHASTAPAFPGAATADPRSGLRPGAQATFSFTPYRAGDYLIACLVAGHEASGMWETFTVAAGGLPSIVYARP